MLLIGGTSTWLNSQQRGLSRKATSEESVSGGVKQLYSVMQTCGQDTQAAGVDARRQLVHTSQDGDAEAIGQPRLQKAGVHSAVPPPPGPLSVARMPIHPDPLQHGQPSERQQLCLGYQKVRRT